MWWFGVIGKDILKGFDLENLYFVIIPKIGLTQGFGREECDSFSKECFYLMFYLMKDH